MPCFEFGGFAGVVRARWPRLMAMALATRKQRRLWNGIAQLTTNGPPVSVAEAAAHAMAVE
eukprot:6207302-Pleurochrysis_carterae.AAC.4